MCSKKENEKEIQNIKNCRNSDHPWVPAEFLVEEIRGAGDYGQSDFCKDE
ncbi:hypothetical protein CHA01nite_12510 [Chryseobacterium hagamense]|uniref:Uncharacterized protein n=1 Tax=Chryseobacterium hagamense TaxID=395935 RepID=A0A511YJY9_9FLAO|nr:hypothetical protein CHA01nite_12510 [Chryseobacterium hagamense]